MLLRRVAIRDDRLKPTTIHPSPGKEETVGRPSWSRSFCSSRKAGASTAGAPLGTDRANNLGWTLGLGVEFVIWGPLTAKAEYLYADFNGFTCNVACGGGPICGIRGKADRDSDGRRTAIR